MATIHHLARAFDLVGGTVFHQPRPPTVDSIRIINKCLGLVLPPSFVEFVQISETLGKWFAGLGDNYLDPHHIFRINRRASRIRRRNSLGGWEYVKPKRFVVFNLGFDQDFDGFNADAINSVGEYEIQYWSPPRIFGAKVYASFPEYIETQIRSWAEYRDAEVRARVSELLSA